MVTIMHDYIETLILRDQANEELYLETMSQKVDKKSSPQKISAYLDEKIEIQLDDIDHKFHIYHHP